MHNVQSGSVIKIYGREVQLCPPQKIYQSPVNMFLLISFLIAVNDSGKIRQTKVNKIVIRRTGNGKSDKLKSPSNGVICSGKTSRRGAKVMSLNVPCAAIKSFLSLVLLFPVNKTCRRPSGKYFKIQASINSMIRRI